MTPSDDLIAPRRRIFFPVVIVTALLTIIGLVGGYLLGERDRHRRAAAALGAVDSGQVTLDPTPSLSGERCPAEAIAFAASEGLARDLSQLLMIQTDNGTTVWICRDGQGALYYQGKTGGSDVPLVQQKNGLFLPNVQQRGEDDYLAIAENGSQIHIDRDSLRVQFADGRIQTNRVVRSTP